MSETAVVTLLFTDLVGSTELSQRLGEEGAEVLRREHTQVLRDAIGATGGDEVKHMGDGLMVVFTSPSEAARCATTMQQGVEKHNRTLPEALGLRVGLHVGEVTKESGDYFGTAVVVAERLCKRADGGQIFTSDILRALVGTRGGHTFKELGLLELKGIDEPVAACELHWEPSTEDRIPFPGGFPDVDRLLFVGREEERERIQTTWKRALAGQRQLALVAGEPGIGKTRLSTELALDAHEQGAIVLFGRCDEDLGIPYQPFAEAIRHYIVHCPLDELLEHVVEHGGEIARLAPELHKRLPDAPKPESGESTDPQQAGRDEDRYRLFEAVVGIIGSATSDAPVLLVLDDLHWATKPTLLLLRHVLRSTEPTRLLIVGTYRDTDLARTHPFAETLADLRREIDVERISLAGLDEDAVAAFVASISGQELSESAQALVRAVHGETEGNPFFVGQVLRHLVETRTLFEKDGAWTYDGPVDRLGIPEGVREVIGRRMSRLSEAANRSLGVASVIGVEFDLVLLERLPDASAEGDVLDALDEAVRSRIVDEVPDSPGRYRFTHTLIRQTLYEELTSARRVRLHERVGEAIEAVHGDGPDVLPALARHFAEAARSGNVLKAAEYAARAGQDAFDRSAFEEAIELAERGLQVLDLDDDSHLVARADLLIVIAQGKMVLEDIVGYRRAALAAAEAARAGGAPDRLAWAAYWYACYFIDIAAQANDLCAEALSALSEGETALRSMMLSMLVVTGWQLGRCDDLGARSAEALEMARGGAEPFALGLATWMRAGFTRSCLGSSTISLDEAHELTDELHRLAEQGGQRMSELNWLRMRAGLRLIEGDRVEFDAALTVFEQLAAEARGQFFIDVAAQMRVADAMLDGRFHDASTLLRERSSRPAASPALALTVPIQLYYLQFERGRPTDPNVLRPGVFAAPRASGYRATLAHNLILAGELEEAREHLSALAADDFDLFRRDVEATSGLAPAAYACALLEDADFASGLYRQSLPHSGRILIVLDATVAIGAADRFLGILAATYGDFEASERHFEDALALEERLASPPLTARTRYWFASMLRRRGRPDDRARIDELLDDCIAVAEELGMVRLVSDARKLRDR